MSSPREYLFGPVPSRRFGRSLGIDLLRRKTCSYNCVFCQLGPTPQSTLERREYVPTDAVLDELRRWLDTGEQANYITLAGNGEPTLHSRFGEVLREIRRFSSIPAVLLTNGSLFGSRRVRYAAGEADVVKISLSAWDEESFGQINRPAPGLDLDVVVEGCRLLQQSCSAAIWLEVMLIDGMNSEPADVAKIARLAERIQPERIQLNTVVRPPAEAGIKPVAAEKLEELAVLFTPVAEPIAAVATLDSGTERMTADELVAIVRRRPCTAADLCRVSGLHPNELAKYTAHLLQTRQLVTELQGGRQFFVAV